ncbi:hypothetical protein BMF94_4594 [Rhodotorula taiwanensis]|uniref:Uncharacterized protein n=1 Tax=Rhodotorula taiwanensis TaxID=741276 RepID=A0A2S5B685_9BASI|nr:hypothetical protein BMF94_4594 [Rhodotorula taiwanensis]
MHHFWQRAHAALHLTVIECLIHSPHATAALPLLAVNKHLRRLAIDSLLSCYALPSARRVPREVVRLSLSLTNPYAPPSVRDDPRFVCQQDDATKLPFHRQPVELYLSELDASSLVCTFKAKNQESAFLRWTCSYAYENHWRQLTAHVPESFSVTPTGWFRPAEPNETGLNGQMLAATPACYPSPLPCFFPEIPENPGAIIQSFDELLPNGWRISYRARRLDWIPEMLEVKSFAASASSRAIIVTVPAYCKVISLKIPFIDLFVAPDRLHDCPWADRPPQPSLTMPRRR